MRLFNTLTRKKEDFSPKGTVQIYHCGPTVYNYVHIGNIRTFLFADILRRWLLYRGFKLKQVQNITDVDDKTIRDSQKEGTPLKEFTERYTKAFFEDMDSLNAQRGEVYPKATEHIDEMVAMIKALLDKGFAYKTDDGIYFHVEKFKSYGELGQVDLGALKPGASGRVLADEYDKENVADFALWKFWDEKDGDVFWETEVGKGRPGWHIECSAMAAKHLTKVFDNDTFSPDDFESIDIHTGGVDLKFPHHDDEIAQIEPLTGKPFAKVWLHAEHLLVDNKKMSKSLGNFYTLRDILEKGHSPLAMRYALIANHYRQKMNFTFDVLEAAATSVQRINNFVQRLHEVKKEGEASDEFKDLVEQATHDFESALDDDLEMSRALAAMFEFMNATNRFLEKDLLTKGKARLALDFMDMADRVLAVVEDRKPLEPDLQKLVDERARARESKDFKRSDELRDELRQKGIAVEDTPDGQRWKRILR